MRKLRWQLLIVIGALSAIALLLLGRQPVIHTVVQEPTTGGVYTEALIGSPGRLNPVLDYYNDADRAIDRLLYNGLVRHDSRGLPQPDLAESWGISQDGTVYNFALRPDVVWHDGEPLTSSDVASTIEWLRDPESPLPEDLIEFWQDVEVRPLDDLNIQFVLPEPYAPFLDYLTFGVLPEHLVGGMSVAELIDAGFNLQPVGSGPYQFDHFLVEDGEITGVVLNAFSDHYVQRPFIDQVVFRYYPQATDALEAYLEGEVLGISQITPQVLAEALRAPDLNLYTARLPALSLIYLNLDNTQVPFFQDVSVRQALMTAINRQRIVNRILNGQAILASGPIFPGTWAYFDGLQPYEYDPDAAVRLLKNAGYTIPAEGGTVRVGEDGPLEFELLYAEGDLNQQLAQAVRDDWADIGVAATLVPVASEALISDHLGPGNYQAAFVELDLARSPDPDPYPFWHQAQITGGQNYARWDDRPASEFLEQARIIVNLEERARLYRNFQARFNRELPALPLFYPLYTYAVDQQVQGVRVGPLFEPSDRFNNIVDWFLLARPSLEEVVTPQTTP